MFEWYSIDTWIVVVGALCAVACAILGNFLVLRQMSMMGDAISHAVLPGLAVAFLITGSRASFVMFAGAAIVGVLTAVFTHSISHYGKVDSGASMGIVFTSLFALGLILIVQGADHVDLDPSCVLYGAIELVAMDTSWSVTWGETVVEIPRAVGILLPVLAVNLLFVTLLFKELRISAFDPALATTQGINADLMHYLLMTLVAITTVASFEVVGSIIVIAMLVVPAATAHLLTDRLHTMIGLSVVFAILAAVLGHVLALVAPGWITALTDLVFEPGLVEFDRTNSSGMMAVAAGVLFALAGIFAPRHGLLARTLGHRRMAKLRIDNAPEAKPCSDV